MDTVYIMKDKCRDAVHVAWISTEERKQYFEYESIGQCRARWEPRGFNVIIVTD